MMEDKSVPVGEPQIPRQKFCRLLGGEIPILEHPGIHPVAVFHRHRLIFLQQPELPIHPGVGGGGVVFHVGIGQNFDAVGAHVIDILEALLQVLLGNSCRGTRHAWSLRDGRYTCKSPFIVA